MFHVPNKYRYKGKRMYFLSSDDSYGNNGFFIIPHPKIDNYEFRVQASDGENWEHVSVSVAQVKKEATRCPTWNEMCWIKNLFWDEEDCVIQYHPSKSEYINMHPFVLHLWKPVTAIIPIPPKILIGI